jgi:hypothetical protein
MTDRIPHDEDDPCPACGAALGQLHDIDCDKERCEVCGGQRISCGCHDGLSHD